MMSPIETYRGVVYPWQIDHMDHMNVQFYTARFDEATWHFFARFGLTPEYFDTTHCGMAAVEQHTRYKRELHAGALIFITTQPLEARPKTLRFVHRMADAETGAEVADTELTGVHMDRIERVSVPFPEEVYERLRAALDQAVGA